MAQRLFDEIKRLIDDTLSGVHTAMPGTITSANGMTASVKPSVTFRTADGKSMTYPSISGCPIVLPMSANGKIGVAFPVSAGDACLLSAAKAPCRNGRAAITQAACGLACPMQSAFHAC